jgi:hypothetical protein
MSERTVAVMDRMLETMERLAGRIVAIEVRLAAREPPPAADLIPPELAEQVRDALRLLYGPTPFPDPPVAQLSGPSRPSRIERDGNGGYSLIYDDDDGPQP